MTMQPADRIDFGPVPRQPAVAPGVRLGGSARSSLWFAQDTTRGPLIDWLQANRERGRFLSDVCNGFESYGTLSEAQEKAVRRAMEQAAAAAPVAPPRAAGLSSIVAMMSRAGEKLKSPKVLLAAGDQQFRLSVAGLQSRNPGTINVCSADRAFEDRDWFGRILADGTFEPSRRAEADVVAKVGQALVCLAADPEAAAKAYGQRFGACCFCGIELTDKASVDAGYGPICARRYGLAHGK